MQKYENVTEEQKKAILNVLTNEWQNIYQISEKAKFIFYIAKAVLLKLNEEMKIDVKKELTKKKHKEKLYFRKMENHEHRTNENIDESIRNQDIENPVIA